MLPPVLPPAQAMALDLPYPVICAFSVFLPQLNIALQQPVFS